MIQFTLTHPRATRESVGFLQEFFSESDPRPAREQIDENYKHGGGWSPFEGFKMAPNGSLLYPDDPPMQVIAEGKLREEIIRLHEYEWVSITQPDGSFEVCRCDIPAPPENPWSFDTIEHLKHPSPTINTATEAKNFYEQALLSARAAEQQSAVLGQELADGWRALAELPITNPGRADLYKREAEKLELILRTINQMREANP